MANVKSLMFIRRCYLKLKILPLKLDPGSSGIMPWIKLNQCIVQFVQNICNLIDCEEYNISSIVVLILYSLTKKNNSMVRKNRYILIENKLIINN